MAITYTKLKSGDWGIRADEPITPGSSVVVVKKDGGTKTETVDRIIWSGDGVTLASIKQRTPTTGASRSSSRRSRSYNVCADCGRGGRLVRDLEDGLLKHYNCCDIPPNGY
jgi:hypothetical protein